MTAADSDSAATTTTTSVSVVPTTSTRPAGAMSNLTEQILVDDSLPSSFSSSYKVLVWSSASASTAKDASTTTTTTVTGTNATINGENGAAAAKVSSEATNDKNDKSGNVASASNATTLKNMKDESKSPASKASSANNNDAAADDDAADVLGIVAPELVVPSDTIAVAKDEAKTDVNVKEKEKSSTSAAAELLLKQKKKPIKDVPVTVIPPTAFNVVLTHATADFDSLASAVGLAKLWAAQEGSENSSEVDSNSNNDGDDEEAEEKKKKKTFRSASHVPTFVVLPRGAHPGVQRFLALHKHLFPIRSLKSLPDDLSGLNRLALVDAQRRDRLGPAEHLLEHANRIVVVDHHIEQDSDIPATDFVVDQVGSVSTLVSEYLKDEGLALTEAEATLLALGIHADTGSLCFDSTTPRDARALSWCLDQGASQNAIAEHAQTSLSKDQQSVLTQALVNVNSTKIHGITLSTVLLSADGFINGLAAVTQDALDLSSSDIFLMGMVYEAHAGRRKKSRQQSGQLLTSRLLTKPKTGAFPGAEPAKDDMLSMAYKDAWKGGKDAMRRRQLRAAFDRKDIDGSGYLDREEIAAALASCGLIASEETVDNLMRKMDADGNGTIDFEEFVAFANQAEAQQDQPQGKKGSTTLILVGRVKAGVSLKSVKLNKLFERFGGGGHAKAASATVRLNEEGEAADIMQGLVDELLETSLREQPTVGDFMTAPALSIKSNMNEKQVEDLFTRYDVRALPVVDDKNDVIGLVTYKEVASAKQRLWNKEQKRMRREQEAHKKGEELSSTEKRMVYDRQRSGTTVKAWMKQHVTTVEASNTMAEVEAMLLENDVGCIPVVADGTLHLVGMVTRTDLLRQHRYYATLHYHNKGFADSIANRRPIIELRRRLKKFDDLDA